MPSEFEKFIAKSRGRSGRRWASIRLPDVFGRLRPLAARARTFAGARWQRMLALPSGWRGRGRHMEEMKTALAAANASIETLAARVAALEGAVELLTRSRHAALQLPFTERTQALKMIRDGRNARQVASALGLPQGEILLLTRVHEIGQAALPPAASAAEPPASGAPRRTRRQRVRL